MDDYEHRVIGPPGCGKTTFLGEEVKASVNRGQKPLIVSLSRAAALEVADRDLPLGPDELGTLHSYCFHQLGQPPIAEGRLKDWNERNPDYPLTGRQRSMDDSDHETGTDARGLGDRALSAYSACRARRRLDLLDQRYQDFAERWEKWKKEQELKDFADLIEICLRDYPAAPTKPEVIFVDEAQDLDQLQMDLLRQWGQAAGQLVIVGDPDQNIYYWRGSDPEAFTQPLLPPEQVTLLDQSYRLPQAVHALAQDWIDRWPDRNTVEFLPRDAPGRVRRIANHYSFVEDILDDLEKEYLTHDKSVMLIASCSYMLAKLISRLRDRGLPFHNPRQDNNGAWNPLQARPGQTTAIDRIVAFLNLFENGQWSAADLQKWTAKVDMKTALAQTKGGRKLIRELVNDDEDCLSTDALTRILTPPAYEAGMAGDLDWLLNNLMNSERERRHVYEYPAQIIRRAGGSDQIREIPKITVGTIHSVKGAEADAVYIFPDLSLPSQQEWHSGASAQGALYRLFYVAMTRAREDLILCQGFGHESEWLDLDPDDLVAEPDPRLTAATH